MLYNSIDVYVWFNFSKTINIKHRVDKLEKENNVMYTYIP